MTLNLETLRHQYKDAILALASAHHADNVRVFGSVVRGEAREDSDLDLLVHFLPGAGLLEWVALERNIEDLLHRRVDIVSDRAIRDELAPYILSEAVVL